MLLHEEALCFYTPGIEFYTRRGSILDLYLVSKSIPCCFCIYQKSQILLPFRSGCTTCLSAIQGIHPKHSSTTARHRT
uniref:Ovule protein n=1 Tax=Meloidogyne incognita TaxID=6306 RepID=A0A914NKT2_MELIC